MDTCPHCGSRTLTTAPCPPGSPHRGKLVCGGCGRSLGRREGDRERQLEGVEGAERQPGQEQHA